MRLKRDNVIKSEFRYIYEGARLPFALGSIYISPLANKLLKNKEVLIIILCTWLLECAMAFIMFVYKILSVKAVANMLLLARWSVYRLFDESR